MRAYLDPTMEGDDVKARRVAGAEKMRRHRAKNKLEGIVPTKNQIELRRTSQKEWTIKNKDNLRIYKRQWALNNYYKNHEENKELAKHRQRRKNGNRARVSPRQLAKFQGKTRYTTGKPCIRGHTAERLVSNGRCIKCMYEYREEYWDKNPDSYYQSLAARYERVQADPRQKLMANLRIRLHRAIRNGNGSAVVDLGCSIPEFMDYIEKQFLPGMTWENWGRDTWHLDHIKPLASFDLTDREQFLEACHYTNFQPLWAMDNMRKNRHALT